MSGLPLQAWHPEVTIPNVFIRLLLYRADLVHSATAYFGHDLQIQAHDGPVLLDG